MTDHIETDCKQHAENPVQTADHLSSLKDMAPESEHSDGANLFLASNQSDRRSPRPISQQNQNSHTTPTAKQTRDLRGNIF